MVSKNNRLKRFEQSAQRQNHFGIRKLSIGAASVLLGTSLYLGTQTSSVKAADNGVDKDKQETDSNQDADQPNVKDIDHVEVAKQPETLKVAGDAATTQAADQKATDQQSEDKKNDDANKVAEAKKATETKQENKQDQKKTQDNKKVQKQTLKVAKTAAKDETKTPELDVKSLDTIKTNLEAQLKNDTSLTEAQTAEIKASLAEIEDLKTNLAASKGNEAETKKLMSLLGASFAVKPNEKAANDSSTRTVTDGNSLQSALSDASVKTINLQGNNFSVSDVSLNHDVTIDGGRNGATLSFGNSTISMNSGILGFFGGNPVKLTLANVTIDSDNAGGAITSDNDNNVITFRNVTNNRNSLFNGKGQVHIQGKVTTNVSDSSEFGDAALQGFADAKNTGAGTNLYGQAKTTTVQQANSAILADINKVERNRQRRVPNIYASNLYIDDNATLTVNRTASGDGIVLRDGARTEGVRNGNITSTVANRGKLNVGNNAILNITLKDGNLPGSQLKFSERDTIDNLNAGVRVNTSGSFTTGNNAIVNIKSGHGRAISFSENNVNTNAKVWGNYVYRGQEGGGDGGYTVSARGTTKFTDFVQQNRGIKNEFKLGNGTKVNVMGREAFMLGNNSVFDSGENSNVLVHNYGHGNALDMGSADGDHPDNDPNHSGQFIVGVGSTVQFFSDGKDTDAGHANFGANNYVSMGGGGKIKVLKDATLRVILTNRGSSTYNDDININSRDPRLSPGVYVGNNAILDVQSDAKQGNAELIAIPLSASKDINFVLDNVKYVNLQKTVQTSATTLAPADPDLNRAAAKAHVPASKAGYGNLIIMNTGRDGKGHLRAFGNLAAFKWDNTNLNSNGLDFDPNQSVSANYSRFERSANQTWSNMYGFDMPYQMFSSIRNSGEVWVDPTGSTAGTNVNSNHGAGFTDFVKGFSPYMSQRLVVIGHSIQPVQNQRTVHYVVQDVDDYGRPVETDPTQMREIANPFVQSSEGNNAQSQLLYKDNATDQLIRVQRNADGTPKLDAEGNVIPVRDANGNYQSDGNRVNKWTSSDDSIESQNGNTYFKSYQGPQTITGKDGNGNTVESLDGGLYQLATDAQLATITSNRNQVVHGGQVANSKNFANTPADFKNGNFYNTYKDGNLYIVYRAVPEKASLKIVDDTENKTLDTVTAVGKDKAPINFGDSVAQTVQDYLNKGYKFVNVHDDTNDKVLTTNGFSDAKFGNFDENPDVDQDFTVHLVHDVIPVTPDTPPADVPKDPDGNPVVDQKKLTKNVTLTVTYQNNDKTKFTGKVPTEANQTLTFKGEVYVDKVTGKLVNVKKENDQLLVDASNKKTPEATWTPEKGSFTAVTSPTETGYHVKTVSAHADKSGKNVAAITDITKDSENINITVSYDKDIAKGQINVKFHDTTDNVDIPNYGTQSGQKDEGTPFTYTPNKDIEALKNKGYVVDGTVPEIPTEIPEGTKDIVINMKHGVTPVTPNTPPTDVPKTPDGKLLVDPTQLTKNVTLNVTYKNSDNTAFKGQAPKNAKQTLKFTGNAYVDRVTGQLANAKQENGQWIVDLDNKKTPAITWTPESGSFTAVTSPAENGYHVTSVSSHADGNNVAAITGVNKDSKDINVTVTYAPNGEDVRNKQDIPAKQTVHFVYADGKQARPDDVQNFDFNYSGDTYDSTTNKKLKTGSWNATDHKFGNVTVPVITGYVANTKNAGGLTATHDNPNVEQTVVYTPIGKIIPIDNVTKKPIPDAPTPQYHNDQNDPTKVVPNEPIPEVPNYLPVKPGQQITPKDPTKDTEVPYKQGVKGTVKYIDDTTKGTLKTDKINGFVGDKVNYATAEIIKGYEDSGYKLVSNNFHDGNETYKPKGNDFEVHFVHTYSPVTPKDPHGVNPKDLTKDVKETVKYVGAGDKTPKDVVQTSQWTRQLTYDNVDKKIVPNGELDKDWAIAPGQKTNYDEVKTPEVEGYHPDQTAVASTPVTQEDITKVVTYSPNGQEVKDKKDVPATQTTKFVDENGKELATSVVQNSNFHFSGNTYDKITGKKIKDGSWNEDSHKFNSVDAPVIKGYVAETKTADGLTATVKNPNVENKVVYHKIGKIIPVDPSGKPIPDAPTPEYKNDPNDPTKVTPNEPIPDINGYVPVDPTPITPEDPTKDTKVVYKKSADGTIKYIDDTTKATLDSVNLPKGFVGDKINYTTADKIAAYEKQGYKFVSNNFQDGKENYKESGNNFEVHFVHNLIPVTPNDPHGVDPSMVQKDVKETVKYEGAGDKTPKDVVQTSQWTRQLTMDQVTGQIIPNGKLDKDWAIAPGQKTNYDEVKTPEVEGYHPNQATVASTPVTQEDITKIVTYSPNGQEVKDQKDIPATQTTKFVDDNGKEIAEAVVQNSNFHYSGDTYDKVTGKQTAKGSWDAESHKFNSVNAPVIIGYVAEAKTADGLTATIENPNVENKIVYHKIGKIIPVDPNHDPIPDAPTPDYENDPKDPTKVVPDEPVPEVPNYTPVDPTPITPDDPTKNTQVVYNQIVEGTVTYIDDTTNQTLGAVDTVKGYVGDKIKYSTQGRIDNYTSKGYKLVSDGFTTSDQVFKKARNNFEVHFVHSYSPVNPQNPNPKVNKDEYSKDYTSTVHYEGAGSQTPKDNVQTSTWTRTLTIDNVTGNIIPGGQYDKDWAPDKKNYDAVPTPKVEGYEPSKTTVPAKPTVQKDITETVIYSPVAKDQKAKVQYIDLDENNKVIEESPELTGKAGDTIKYSTAEKIKELTNKGYELANDGFPEGAAFDNIDDNEQVFKVTFHHGHQPITPDKPGKPGEPINPDDPEGPKFPADSDKVTKDITRTIHYEGAGNNSPSDIKQTVHFEAKGELDKVTGQWTTPLTWSGDQTVVGAKTPVVEGYYVTGVDKDSKDNVNVDSATINHDGSDYTVTVNYAPVGKIIPVDPSGNPIPKAPNPPYENDPTDPTKVVPNEPVPVIPGYTPNQPTVTPNDPGKDTTIIYTKNPDKAAGKITYIDDTTKSVLDTDNFSGNVGDKINYTTAKEIDNYISRGYELVSNDFKDGQEVFAKEGNNFEVHLKHATEEITPKTPDPKHGFTTDSLTKHGKQTVHYIVADGGVPAPADATQTITLEHTLFIDKVTGNVIADNGWNMTSPNFEAVVSPDVAGYTADKFFAGGQPYEFDPKTGNPINGTDLNPSYTVVYTKNPVAVQGKITYIDDTTKSVLDTNSFSGNVGDKINYITAGKIKNYESNGYKLVSNEFHDGDEVFTNGSNNFEVHFVHNQIPVNPNNPHDGVDKNDIEKDVKETVHYVGADNNTPNDVVQTSKWGRTVTYDEVTKKVVPNGQYDTDWAIQNGQKTVYDQVNTPVVKNYHADKSFVPVTGVTQDDIEITVNYSPNGKIIPVDPSGNPIPKVPNPPYENDPTDPTRVTPNEPVPQIPGYVPSVPSVTPNDPGKDTKVVYTPILKQNAVVNYIDSDNNNSVITTSGNLSGKAGSVIDYSTAATIKQLQDKGYVLVNNGFDPNGQAPSFDNDDNTTQTYQVILKHGTTPVTPDKPGKPGEPINPNDPEGPKFPDGTDKNSLIKTGTQTVHYEGAGNNTPGVNTTTVEFDHSMVVDNVTGKIITDNGWTPSSRTYTSVVTPTIPGYTPDKVVVGGDTVNVNDDNINREYTVHYTKDPVAAQGKVSYIDDTTGKTIDVDNFSGNVGDKINYTTADKISNFESQGYELVSNNFKDGQEVFAENGNNFEVHLKHGTKEVTPKDPDPEHGFSHDSLIKTGTQTVSYTGVKGENPQSNITKVEFDHTLVIDKVTGKVVTDNGWTPSSQTYNKVTTPNVPGYTPDKTIVGGETVTINPQTGEGEINKNYIVNYTKNPDDKVVNGTQTVHYVDQGGKELRKTEVTGHVTFTQNGMTGEWDNNSYTYGKVTVPVIDGYVAEASSVDGKTVTPTDPNQEVWIHYQKVGNIIPLTPDGKHIPDPSNPSVVIPNKPFINDPTDPTKVIPNEPVPSIPGLIPSTPTVTPNVPTVDIPVIYHKDETQKAQVQYIDQDNNNSVITQSDILTGKAGDTINYSTAETIKNLENKGYELVADNFKNAIFDNVEGNTQVFQVIMKHGKTPVNPDKPGKPGEPINPNDPEGPKWPDGTDKNSLIKTGTQTVIYEGAGNNTPAKNVTTVEFDHSMVVDNVTGKIVTDNGWTPSSQTYNTIKTPSIAGYTPSVEVVGGDTVKATDGNLNREYTVTYTQIPDTPVTPEVPDPNPIPVPHPEPEPVPEVPEEEPDIPAPHGEDVPTAPEEVETPKPAPEKVEAPADEPAPKPHAAALPQTGSENDDLVALAGAAMSLIGLVGLAGAAKRRRRN